jgi:hypothetical protein
MHTGEGGRHLMYPLKIFKKVGHKNAININVEPTPLDFLTTPITPGSKKFAEKHQGPPFLGFQLMCRGINKQTNKQQKN